MFLNDRAIFSLAAEGMIDPFEGQLVREVEGARIISYGLSSMGYDLRLGRELLIFHNLSPGGAEALPVDPKAFDKRVCMPFEGHDHQPVIIPANGFALAHTVETLKMPDDVIGICVGKSTYARVGVILNVTPIEPGWRGQVTLEITNSLPRPVKVYPGEGIVQILFARGESPRVTYSSRNGKYQDQKGVTPAKV